MEYEGAVYHVMSRGNKRGLIFEDDEDRKVFLLTIGEVCYERMTSANRGLRGW